MPDVKAYLALLGTESNKITWFHQPQLAELTPEQADAKKRMDEAVVRGVKILQQRRREKRG